MDFLKLYINSLFLIYLSFAYTYRRKTLILTPPFGLIEEMCEKLFTFMRFS